jgi:hypothetical protein
MIRGGWRHADKVSEYVEKEKLVSGRWRQAVADMPDDSGLALIPWGHGPEGEAAEYEDYATEVLGDRFFLLDVPMMTDEGFWDIAVGDLGRKYIGELKSAYLGQRHGWNLEELDTAVHSLTAAHEMGNLMKERKISYDPGSVTGEAWGAAFEGCVMKYIGNLNRILGLANPIEVNYDMGVPDAGFILKVERWERYKVDGPLRFFIFEVENGLMAFYYATDEGMDYPARVVDVPLDPTSTRVIGKLGSRMWPGRPRGRPPKMELGYFEPAQKLVEERDGRLRIPVNGGLVYRRAKAPAYILPEEGTTWAEFRDILLQGEMDVRPPTYV